MEGPSAASAQVSRADPRPGRRPEKGGTCGWKRDIGEPPATANVLKAALRLWRAQESSGRKGAAPLVPRPSWGPSVTGVTVTRCLETTHCCAVPGRQPEQDTYTRRVRYPAESDSSWWLSWGPGRLILEPVSSAPAIQLHLMETQEEKAIDQFCSRI